ncbi:MAG TPA: MBG domain-containing protein [Prolixibacteraceae bacterium]|jgi:hypothetical protein
MKNNFVLRLKSVFFPMLIMLLMAISLSGKAQTVTILTDKDDYYPGETVVITGSGWIPGDQIELSITHVGDNIPDHTHAPWTVVSDSKGNLHSEWSVGEMELHTTLWLKAQSLSVASMYAEKVFTDSPKVGSVAVGTQTPSAIIPGYSATYSITVNRGTGPGKIDVNLQVSSVLPAGVTALFSSNPLTMASQTNSATTTVTLSTTSSSPVSINDFTVRAYINASDQAFGNGVLEVMSKDPVITWNNPADITYGTALNESQLNASASVAGTFVYSPVAGSILNAGPQTFSVIFTPTNPIFNEASKSVSINVNKKDASVVVDPLIKEYGSADPTMTGTLEGFLEADQLTATYSRVAGETVLGAPYAITADLSPTEVLGNYNITNIPAALEITPKDASVVVDAFTKEYGADDPTLTGVLEGFLEADNVTAAYNRVFGESVLDGPYTITADLSPTDVLSNYNIINTPAVLEIATKEASVVVDALTKEYGAQDPALTGTLEGFLEADKVIATYSRGAGETVLGGPYTISADLSPAQVLSNYNLTISPAKLTITPKDASVVIDSKTKIYGSEDPILTGTLEGFLEADMVTAAYHRTGGETVTGGPYAITADLMPIELLSNYNITNTPAALEITLKDASVVVDGLTKEYGSEDPTLTGTLEGFLEADKVTATYRREAGETVLDGPYAITADLSPTVVLGNYNITNNPAALEITLKDASVVVDGLTKEYGSADPTLTGTMAGFLEADKVTVAYSREAGETVTGGPYAITADLTSTNVLGNYNITITPAALEITRKDASVIVAVLTKEYGAEDPALTGTLEGFLDADQVTATYSRVVGETVTGGPYAITADLSPTEVLSNYKLTISPAMLTITPKNASVVVDSKTKVYGSEDPTLTGTLKGFLEADIVTAAYSRVAGETVLGGPYAINAELSPTGVLGNYNLNITPAGLAITVKEASVQVSHKTKVYGSADPSLTGVLEGFLSDDHVAADYIRETGESVVDGPYTITAILSPAEVLSNYQITNNDAQLSIEALSVKVTADAKSKLFGASDPTLTFTSVPAVGSVLGNGEIVGFAGSLSRVAGENVGAYAIDRNNVDNSNYAIDYTGAKFTVHPLTVAIHADAISKTYGSLDPVLTFHSDLAEGTEIGNGEVLTFSGSLIRYPAENVGKYEIHQGSLAVNGNFKIVYTGADLTITPLFVAVTAEAKTKIYGEADPALTFKSEPIVGSRLANGDAINFTGALSRIDGENVGTYTMAQNSLGNSNYDIGYNNASLTITPLAVSVTADAKAKTYGDVDPALTYASVPGVGSILANGESISFTGSLSREAGENVDSYAIAQNDLANSNYTIAFKGANLVIDPLTVSVTAEAKSKTYGELDPALTFVSVPAVDTELANGELVTINSILTRSEGENVGSYDITQMGAINENFTIAFTGAKLSITPLAITVNAESKSKTYGELDPPLTFVSVPELGFELPNGEKVGFSGSLSRTDGEIVGSGMASRVSRENVGSYVINQNTLANSNYTIAYTAADLAIGKLAVAVNIDAKTKEYGAKDPELTFKSVPAVGSELANHEVVGFSGALSRIAGEEAGTYAIGHNTLDNGNYNILFNGADLSITPWVVGLKTVVTDASLNVYPNPFEEKLYFDFSWKKDAQARLEIYDITGAKLATVFNGQINGNEKYQLEYVPRNVRPGMLMYRLFIDGQVFNGKIVYDPMK